MASPFALDNEPGYQSWKAEKLADYPTQLSELMVQVYDSTSLSSEERQAIACRVQKTNMALVSAPTTVTSDTLKRLGEQLGLSHLDANIYSEEDAITALAVQNRPSRQQAFIPYTNKPIAWHTDGYYNPLDKQIRGMILYFATPAPKGGENALLDPEIAYIHLRDRNPDFIRALSAPEVLTIPAHESDGHILRPAQTGPVFSVQGGQLHMRYTHRSKSADWTDSTLVKAALACLHELFEPGAPGQFRGKLEAGHALVCNNVLHNRSGFEETGEQQRLVYRGRYYERISIA